jgi:short-subunit dehydrogenase
VITNAEINSAAAQAFMSALRREWTKRNISSRLTCPIPSWSEFDADAKAAFVRSMGVAIASSKIDNMQRVADEAAIARSSQG